MQCVENCDDPQRQVLYEQPVWQTLQMFLGMFITQYGQLSLITTGLKGRCYVSLVMEDQSLVISRSTAHGLP